MNLKKMILNLKIYVLLLLLLLLLFWGGGEGRAIETEHFRIHYKKTAFDPAIL